ncbi:MAG: glutamine synthetase [Oleispira sp.]|nr:glutamine synthetase [Oleispira sp.]
MNPRDIQTASQARELIQSLKPSHIKVGIFDIDGILRGKYMSREKFLSALNKGFGFCDVVLGWDMRDQLYDNTQYTGWHSGYPDAPVRLLPASCRTMPLENDGLFFLAEFTHDAEKICPRGLLRRVLSRAEAMGIKALAGFEYEFFVFNESSESIREKSYKNLNTMAAAEFGYSIIRNSVHDSTYHNILNLSEKMDFPLEGLHEETGPGVLEAAIAYDDALEAADKASLFKTFTKVAMQKENKVATFMARWNNEQPGQSGHIHLSLRDLAGQTLFYDPDQPHQMSELMQHFVAGQQQLMPELLSMIAPTINSYRRLVPGFWAPTDASVGVDNRTCAIRIIPGDETSQRLEYRIGAADANPYIILAAVIASGLWGIENKTQLRPMVKGNAYQQNFDTDLKLPETLWQSTQRLKKSAMARDYFGDEFVDHFSATREWEVREYRKHISQWELDRYFEII